MKASVVSASNAQAQAVSPKGVKNVVASGDTSNFTTSTKAYTKESRATGLGGSELSQKD